MKLREAHKSDDSSSLCSVLWDSNGDHILTASSSDNAICIHDAITPSNAPKFLRHHREGVTALALSPNSTCLASGSIDHSVKLYKFPGISSSSFYFWLILYNGVCYSVLFCFFFLSFFYLQTRYCFLGVDMFDLDLGFFGGS